MSLPLPPDVIAVLVLLAGCLVAFVGAARVSGGARGARLARRKSEILAGRGTPATKVDDPRRRRAIAARLREADKDRKGGSKLRDELRMAGASLTPGRWTLFSSLATVALIGLGHLSGTEWGTAVCAGAIAGLGVPRLALRWKAAKRKARFMASFADAMDIIVRGLRSGLPLGVCVAVIGRELPEPIGAEFRLISEGQRFGMSLREALDRAAERMPTPEMRFFAISVAIQQQTGGNLAETLARLSDVIRARKRMRDKVRAFSSEAKASAGIIGSMPFAVMLLMTLTSPRYLDVLFSSATGHTLLGIGVAMMTVGSLVIRRMIDFDI